MPMDFHSLSRKELQTLCKKNKIPANITNVAMADALGSLHHVEGLDELLNPVECDAPQFTEERVVRTPLTSCRTSARRRPVKEERESSKVLTRLGSGTRGHDDNDLNVPATPAIPSSKRSAPAESTCRKKETQKPEDEKNEVQEKQTYVPKTPVASTSRTRATGRSTGRKLETPDGTVMQLMYRTRRSMRLLEKNLADMSLRDNEDMRPVDMDDISEEKSEDTQMGASSHMDEDMDTEDMGPVNMDDFSEEKFNVSKETENSEDIQMVYGTGAIYKTDELEFTSLPVNMDDVSGEKSNVSRENGNSEDIQKEELEKIDELEFTFPENNTECESQSHDSNPQLQLGLEVATDARVSPDTELLEPFEEMRGSYKRECADLSSKREVSFETKNDTDELEFTSPERSNEIESQTQDSKSEVQLGLEVATAARAGLETEPTESFTEMESRYEFELHDLNSKPDAGSETKNDTIEVLECSECDESDADLNKSTEKYSNIESVDKGAGSLFDLENSSKLENMVLPDVMQDDALSVELNDDYTVEVPDKDVAGLLHLLSVNDEVRPEECDNQDKNKEDEIMNASDGYDIHNSELLVGASDKSDENDFASPESYVEPRFACSCTSTDEQHGNMEEVKDPSVIGSKMLRTKEPDSEFEFLSELEESQEDVVKMAIICDYSGALPGFLDVGKDQNSEHFFANLEACIPEETAITKEDSYPSADETLKLNSPSNQIGVGNVNEVIMSNMTVPPIYEPKTSEISKVFADQLRCQNSCLDQSGDSEPKENTNENGLAQKKGNGQKIHKVKENLNIDELQNKSLRELRKMIRNLSIDPKIKKTDNSADMQAVERKRTVLVVLPENQMISGEAQNDD